MVLTSVCVTHEGLRSLPCFMSAAHEAQQKPQALVRAANTREYQACLQMAQ